MRRSGGRALLGAVVLAVLATGCRDWLTVPIKDQDEDEASKRWSPPGDEGDPEEVPSPTGCPPLCPPGPPAQLERKKIPNPIPAENQRQGHPGWRDGHRARNGELDLYTDVDSVTAGGRVGVKVSADKSLAVTAEVFRIGWYGGAGARRMWSGGPFTVEPQAKCALVTATGLVECDWQTTLHVDVGEDWVSGLYVVKLRRPDGFKRFAPFVVRDDRAPELLVTPNFTTYQAYNTWGGESLYYDRSGKMPRGRAWQVSFNRPYEALDGMGKTFTLDMFLVQFIERHGYDATYATQLDFLRFGNLLEGVPAMVHGGQDEYWPVEERDQVDAALATGETSLAYFGGNGAYWRIRMSTDQHGHPLRILHCYKSEPEQDPVPHSTIRFRDEPGALPENTLFGAMYEGWQLIPFPLVIAKPAHWLFEGTGLQAGDQLQGLVGYEYDRAFTSLPGYPGGVQESMSSPVVSAEGVPSYASTVDRTLPGGTLVFAAGTIWWPLGLSADPEFHDARVERMTLNVLERALAHHRAPRALQPAGSARPAPPPPVGEWATDVRWFSGTTGKGGLTNGSSAAARFDSPTGLAVTAAGEVLVADTGNNRIRLIGADPARTVTTIAGNGELGYRDGDGATAMFRVPTALAVGPGGEVYVADSDNHVIRRMDRTGAGWTVSTVAGAGFKAGFAEGIGTGVRFNRPTSIAVDAAGNLFVADQANNRIRKIRALTGEVVTIAGSGDDGHIDAATGTSATFSNPSAVAVAADGTIYVLDTGFQRVRRIQPNAMHSVDTIAGDDVEWNAVGFADGPGNAARFRAQMGMVVEADGAVILSDTANYRLRRIVPGANAAATRVVTVAGDGRFGTTRGPGSVANLVAPSGLALGPAGQVFVTDPFHHVVLEVELQQPPAP